METTNPTTETVACTLTASEKRMRRDELRLGVLTMIIDARETKDGFALGFGPGAVDAVRELVAFESQCCGFMKYEIDTSAEGRTWLYLNGPEGTKQILRSWLPATILDTIDARKDGGDGRRLLKAGAGGLLAAVLAVVACESPLLAALLVGIGAGSAVRRVGGWLDGLAVLLLLLSAGLVVLALYRRRRRRS